MTARHRPSDCDPSATVAVGAQLNNQPATGNLCLAVEMRGPLDVDALRGSLVAFIQRYEISGTVFPIREGRPRQTQRADGIVAWSEVDLGDLADGDREEETHRLQEGEARRAFDLSRGPLVRALLVRLGYQGHRLVLTLHNLISDWASLVQVFMPELCELYMARIEGRPAELGDVQFQHADSVIGQRDRPDEDADGIGLEFWREYLAGAPLLLDLPRDHRRPTRRSCRAASEPFTLSEELTAGLRELGRQTQGTMRTTLAATLAALLFRYTGEEDLLVGSTAHRDAGVSLQRPMGRFVDSVALRVDLSGQPSVLDLLKRTQAADEMTHGHESASCGAAVNQLHPEDDPDARPMVQVRLVFEPLPPPLPVEWDLVHVEPPVLTTRCDLSVEVDERPSGLAGRFVYDSDLYEPGTVRRTIEHWRKLIEGMVAAPECPLGELQLLRPDERLQLLSEWSMGREPDPGPDIVTLIAEQARSRPDAVAVTCEGEQLTYRQMNERANQLARYLRELGVKSEVPVGLCLERSPDHVVALLGVLKAGGAYVPLDPEAPTERIRYVLKDSGMPLVLTEERLLDKVSGTGTSVVVLDSARKAIGGQRTEEPDREPTDSQLAYIIYTSGSTGHPKGVMIERGALSAHCRAMSSEYRLGASDRVLQFGQYSADASLEQILPTLAAGGRLVMRGTELWTPWQLLVQIRAHKVTVANLSPAHWTQAVQEWTRTSQELTDLELRLVILGGERLGIQTVQQWRELGLPGVRLVNAYGPTEATITATLGEAGEEHDPISIGRPLAGRRVYILDHAGEPVPAGVVGELHIGGELLARGYLNRPQLTEERFVPDRLGSRSQGRMYRTGDLARYLADGRIDYIGRKDDQVQIRGYRVELGEVEAVLAEHPAVEEAVVVARGDAGDVHLVAHIVTRASETLEEAELRRYLAGRLPRHMQPTRFARLANMPRLATGKPDRRKLPELDADDSRDKVPFLAPRTLVEEQLVRIWEELLEPRPIGINDNFFHLGGHSLLAGQLVDRIDQTFDKKLLISTLFAMPTVAQLAVALDEDEAAAGSGRVLPLQASGNRRPFFFLHGDWTGGAFYCFVLARAFGTDQPFYVLEPCTFSGEDTAPTVESIASTHVASMRRVQAEGPYRLGGFCNGGLLAYEMARQLEAEGHEVEFLGLINPSEPVQFSAIRAVFDGLRSLGLGRSTGPADLYLRTRQALRHVYRHLRPHDSRLEDFPKLLAIEPQLEAMFPPRDALYQDYVGVFSWAAAAHKSGEYGGRITFFWARDEPGISQTWLPVLRRKAPTDIEEHTVTGTHMSCVTNHIEGLAETVSECLNQLEQEVVGASSSAREGAPPQGVSIRPLRGHDVRAVVSLERSAFPTDPWTTNTARGWLARSRVGSRPRYAGWVARAIRFVRVSQIINMIRLFRLVASGMPATLSCLVAEEGSTIVGYACLDAVTGGQGDIQMIAVESTHRGRGIGSALLAELMDTAASRGCSGVLLYVRADNPGARRLYRHLGFTPTGALPGFYQPSGTDAITMGLQFQNPTNNTERRQNDALPVLPSSPQPAARS